MRSVSGNTIASHPAQLAALPPAIHQGFVQAFGHSLTFVFLIGVPFAAIAFVICWAIPEVPLRDRASLSVGLEEAIAEGAPISDDDLPRPPRIAAQKAADRYSTESG